MLQISFGDQFSPLNNQSVSKWVEVMQDLDPNPIQEYEEAMIVAFFKSDYLDLEIIRVAEVGIYTKLLPIYTELLAGLEWDVSNEHQYLIIRVGELSAEWTRGFRFEGGKWVRGMDS
jgi:hypothetical protein